MIADAWCAIAGSSSEPSRDGSTKRVAKVGGKVGATSEIVLSWGQNSHINLFPNACLMSCARSPSDISPKLPNDSQILINLFDLKKPPSLDMHIITPPWKILGKDANVLDGIRGATKRQYRSDPGE